jgi:hypothetical protein
MRPLSSGSWWHREHAACGSLSSPVMLKCAGWEKLMLLGGGAVRCVQFTLRTTLPS